MFKHLLLAIFASSLCTAVRGSRLGVTPQQTALPRGSLDDFKPLPESTPSSRKSAHDDCFEHKKREDVAKQTLVKRASKRSSGLPHGYFVCNHQKPKREPKGGFRSLHVTDDAFFYAAARVAGTLAAHAALSRFAPVPGFGDPTQMAATVGMHAVASGMMAPYVYNASQYFLGKAQRCVTPLCQALQLDNGRATLSSPSPSEADQNQKLSVAVEEVDSSTTRSAGRQSRSRYAQKALKQKGKAMVKHR